ncbi:MAG: hypothetical protein KF861_11335, partial [Planctomycetaceae bacterium]|nr:hypothetical protein [Planctomycetaceae bacterium]
LTGGSRKQATSTFDLNFVDRPNDSAVMRGFKGRLGGEFQTSAGPGWHKSWSDTATVQPHVLAQLLRKDQSLFLVVDRRRTGVVLPDELKEVHYLWTSLPPEAAAQVSPVVLSAGTNLEWVSVAMDAWGSDGLLYVLATDSPENVLESLRAACRADDPNSIVGFCWPSIAARLLELPDISHQPALAGVAALLCEQADDPQTWLLFTRDDPVQLLSSFGMKQAEGQAGEKDATGQLAASGGPAR